MDDQPSPPLDIFQMRSSAPTVAAVLRAVGNENRLLLLCQMTHGERSVSQLEADLLISQPTLSQQLGVLRAEGLVTTRREGKRIFYAVSDVKLLILLGTLYTLYCEQP